MICKHEHVVPVSRPPIHEDPDTSDHTLWRCVDCGATAEDPEDLS